MVEFYAKVVLPFLVGLTTVKSIDQLKLLAWVILLSLGYLAFELNLTYLGGYNRVWEEGFGGMDNNCVAIAMVTGVGLAFFLGMAAREWWKRGVALLAAALMAHVIMLSFSRGGMLALALTGLMSFFLIPKKPGHYLAFTLACWWPCAGRAAGARTLSVVVPVYRTGSARSVGPEPARPVARSDGHRARAADPRRRPGQLGLSRQLRLAQGQGGSQPVGAERGGGRLRRRGAAAELFFLLAIKRLWPLTQEACPVNDPWEHDAARMVIASLFGFVIAAQFVTIKYLEVPFYVALIGAGTLMLSRPAPVTTWKPALAAQAARLRRRRVRVPV